MAEASEYLPSGWTPVEEQMFEKAECSDCALKKFEGARAWAHEHVRETGHRVQVHVGYDVRDEHWLERLPYDRLAEIERLRSPKESDDPDGRP